MRFWAKGWHEPEETGTCRGDRLEPIGDKLFWFLRRRLPGIDSVARRVLCSGDRFVLLLLLRRPSFNRIESESESPEGFRGFAAEILWRGFWLRRCSLSLSLGLSFCFDGFDPLAWIASPFFTFCFRPWYLFEFLVLATYFIKCLIEFRLFVGHMLWAFSGP